MKWYYAVGQQQQGPLDDAQFDALIAAGTITPETLVWREGQANWQPLRVARPGGATAPLGAVPPIPNMPGAASGAAALPRQVQCGECRAFFQREETIQYGSVNVCAACKPVFLQKLAEGASVGKGMLPDNLEYAGLWIRFVAKFIDGIVALVVVGVPAIILIFIGISNSGGGQQGRNMMIAMQALIQIGAILFGVAYNTFMVGKYGGTLGKLAVGIRVIQASGEPVSFLRAFGRACADILSSILCYIGYIIAAFDAEKRTLHDHICSTRVIYKPR